MKNLIFFEHVASGFLLGGGDKIDKAAKSSSIKQFPNLGQSDPAKKPESRKKFCVKFYFMLWLRIGAPHPIQSSHGILFEFRSTTYNFHE